MHAASLSFLGSMTPRTRWTARGGLLMGVRCAGAPCASRRSPASRIALGWTRFLPLPARLSSPLQTTRPLTSGQSKFGSAHGSVRPGKRNRGRKLWPGNCAQRWKPRRRRPRRPRESGHFGSQNSKKSPKRCVCAFFIAISAQWERPPWFTSNKSMRSSLAGAGKALSRFLKGRSRASEKEKTRCSSCTHCA